MTRYSTVILVCLAVLVLGPLAAPMLADSPEKGTHLAVGTKVRVSPTTELTLLKVNDNSYTWNAKITPQLATTDGAAIDPSWHYEKGQWIAGNNLFAASVNGATVTVEHDGETLIWTPRLTRKATLLLLPNDKQLESDLHPTLLAIDPWNANYFGNTLRWDYGNGITRNVRLIEGLIQEYYEIAAPVGADVEFDVRPTVSKGYEWSRPLVAWDAAGAPVELVYDSEYVVRLPKDTDATYPITIDPDSSFVTSASDGVLVRDDTDYEDNQAAATADYLAAASTTATVGQTRWYSGSYWYDIYRSFVYFDTSGLPDNANVTAATVNLRGSSDSSTTNFAVTIISGMPTYPADPLAKANYNIALYNTTSLGSINTADWSTAGYNAITLNAAGRNAVNVTGTTKFGVVSQWDIDINIPSGDEYVAFYTYEQGTGYWPYLNVTYTAAAAPVATTLAASNVANSTARLNAYINSSGGELCDVRFEYGNTTETYTDATAWVNDTYDTGSYPYADITDLASNTTYYYRVQVANSQGLYNGTELSFTTESSVGTPTSLFATVSGDSISLSWIRGTGATNTLVRGKAGSYPSSTTDGTQVYFGPGGTATHSNLSPGTTYYYAAWGESGGAYSTNTATTLATTGIGASVTDTPAAPSAPTNWWTDTDPSVLESLPLYDDMCDVIDGYGMQQSAGWMFVFLSIVVLVGAAAFGSTNGNIMVAGAATAITIFTFSILKLLPMWMMGFVLIIFISVAVVRDRT